MAEALRIKDIYIYIFIYIYKHEWLVMIFLIKWLVHNIVRLYIEVWRLSPVNHVRPVSVILLLHFPPPNHFLNLTVCCLTYSAGETSLSFHKSLSFLYSSFLQLTPPVSLEQQVESIVDSFVRNYTVDPSNNEYSQECF